LETKKANIELFGFPRLDCVWMDGLEEFQQELARKNYKYLNPGIERNEDLGLKDDGRYRSIWESDSV
jgi:hypothetical protein